MGWHLQSSQVTLYSWMCRVLTEQGKSTDLVCFKRRMHACFAPITFGVWAWWKWAGTWIFCMNAGYAWRRDKLIKSRYFRKRQCGMWLMKGWERRRFGRKPAKCIVQATRIRQLDFYFRPNTSRPWFRVENVSSHGEFFSTPVAVQRKIHSVISPRRMRIFEYLVDAPQLDLAPRNPLLLSSIHS